MRALLWLLLAAAASAQTPDATVTAGVSPSRCKVGETVEYRAKVTVRNAATERIEVTPPSFKGCDIQGDPSQSRQAGDEFTVLSFIFRLRPRQTGITTITPFEVSYDDARDGRRRSAASPRVNLVVDPAAEGPDIRPAHAVVETPNAMAPYRAAMLFCGVVCLLGALTSLVGWAAARWRQRRLVAALPAPPVPAHERALRLLAELEAMGRSGRRQIDAYHVRLSDILREYLGARFGFNARESTTSEIASRLYGHDVAAAQLKLARSVLDGCDRVKFAEHAPTSRDMDGLLAGARELVIATRPAEEPPT